MPVAKNLKTKVLKLRIVESSNLINFLIDRKEELEIKMFEQYSGARIGDLRQLLENYIYDHINGNHGPEPLMMKVNEKVIQDNQDLYIEKFKIIRTASTIIRVRLVDLFLYLHQQGFIKEGTYLIN